MATIRDFIAECENYEYSKEYFNIMKECAELHVQSHYLKTQEMLSYGCISPGSFTEGYLIESCTAERLAELREAVEAKANNIFTKIWNGLKKLWEAFVAFLKSVKRRFSKEGDFTPKKLNTEQAMEVAANLTEKYAEKLFNPENGQFEIPFDTNISGLLKMYSKGARGKKFTIKVAAPRAVKAEIINKVMNRLPKVKTAHEIKSLRNTIENAMGKWINVEFSLDTAIPELLETEIENIDYLKTQITIVDKTEEIDQELAELDKLMHIVVPATEKMYVNIIEFRDDLVKMIKEAKGESED